MLSITLYNGEQPSGDAGFQSLGKIYIFFLELLFLLRPVWPLASVHPLPLMFLLFYSIGMSS